MFHLGIVNFDCIICIKQDVPISFVDGSCQVTDMEFDPNQLLFGLKNGPGNIPHIYTTNGALHFAQSNGLVGSSLFIPFTSSNECK